MSRIPWVLYDGTAHIVPLYFTFPLFIFVVFIENGRRCVRRDLRCSGKFHKVTDLGLFFSCIERLVLTVCNSHKFKYIRNIMPLSLSFVRLLQRNTVQYTNDLIRPGDVARLSFFLKRAS